MSNLIRYPAVVNPVGDLERAVASFRHSVLEQSDLVRAGVRSFEDAEHELIDAVRVLACASVRELATAAVPDSPVLEVDGERYRRMGMPTMGHYRGLHGPFSVSRRLYRKVGCHNGPTIDPVVVCAALGTGSCTPAAAVASAHLLQLAPSREGAELASSLGVMPYSRTTLLRCGVAMGDRWDHIRGNAESQLMELFEVPEEAVSVAVSVDRVSLPMAEDRERTEADVARGTVRPLSVVYRMAYCAVWSLYDAKGEPLHSVRYAWLPDEGKEGCIDVLASDLWSLHEMCPRLRIVTLADGAPEMQSILDQAVQGLPVCSQLVDFWHLIEKLAAALQAAGPADSSTLSRWKRCLLEDDAAIEAIEESLLRWKSRLRGSPPEPLHNALTYIGNHRERLRYASTRGAALPIGSGHVEATCKTIVSTRMKRAGARWKPDGARATLHLRALATSSRWRPAMRLITASFKRDVKCRAA